MKLTKAARAVAWPMFFALVFLAFFNGYKAEGPSRKKFKKLGEGEVDLTREEEAPPEIDRFKAISGDKRLKDWAGWWRACASGFSLGEMEDVGLSSIHDEDIPPLTPDQISDGPGRMLYQRSPDGRRYLNPYWGRLLFRKEAEGWQPYVEVPCGAALYTPASMRARRVLDCSALEGVEDAYWRDRETIVLMGYTAVSRQMNVECETVESCVAPTVWILDLKSATASERRGPLARRKSCDLGGYIKQRLPEFFGKEK